MIYQAHPTWNQEWRQIEEEESKKLYWIVKWMITQVHFRYRTRRRKNRYEPKPYDPLVVPSQDFNAAATIPDNQLYDRDSSYDPPSSSYNSPADSYSPPSSSYEESRPLNQCMTIFQNIFLITGSVLLRYTKL